MEVTLDLKPKKAYAYLLELCNVQPNRRTGSPGNRQATAFFAQKMREFGFDVDTQPFSCLDYKRGNVSLALDGQPFEIFGSPYSLGCDVHSGILVVSTLDELSKVQCEGKILLMKGEICSEQLMPKNFIFYNPEHHQEIIALLEAKKPAAIITATRFSPEQVGALNPFPLIVDGDFDIPSVYSTAETGEELSKKVPGNAHLRIEAQRVPSSAYNVVAKMNPEAERKIVFCAHIDAYEDSPGASDNASGVVVLLLLAQLLQGYSGSMGIEIVAFNGEDHYSVGGQMDYLRRYGEQVGNIDLLVNIDDVGFINGRSAYSFYACSEETQMRIRNIFEEFDGCVEGDAWYSGDHMIFVQQQVPSLAFTAEWMPELMRTVTHTEKDTPDLINPGKLVDLSAALAAMVKEIA